MESAAAAAARAGFCDRFGVLSAADVYDPTLAAAWKGDVSLATPPAVAVAINPRVVPAQLPDRAAPPLPPAPGPPPPAASKPKRKRRQKPKSGRRNASTAATAPPTTTTTDVAAPKPTPSNLNVAHRRAVPRNRPRDAEATASAKKPPQSDADAAAERERLVRWIEYYEHQEQQLQLQRQQQQQQQQEQQQQQQQQQRQQQQQQQQQQQLQLQLLLHQQQREIEAQRHAAIRLALARAREREREREEEREREREAERACQRAAERERAQQQLAAARRLEQQRLVSERESESERKLVQQHWLDARERREQQRRVEAQERERERAYNHEWKLRIEGAIAESNARIRRHTKTMRELLQRTFVYSGVSFVTALYWTDSMLHAAWMAIAVFIAVGWKTIRAMDVAVATLPILISIACQTACEFLSPALVGQSGRFTPAFVAAIFVLDPKEWYIRYRDACDNRHVRVYSMWPTPGAEEFQTAKSDAMFRACSYSAIMFVATLALTNSLWCIVPATLLVFVCAWWKYLDFAAAADAIAVIYIAYAACYVCGHFFSFVFTHAHAHFFPKPKSWFHRLSDVMYPPPKSWLERLFP